MPEKLLTIDEVSNILGISEEKLTELVEKGELPAYKIGGCFLRFRKEQIEAIRSELPAKLTAPQPERIVEAAVKPPPKMSKTYPKRPQGATYSQSPLDSVKDFFYFNDFYIFATTIVLLILWVIFKA